MRSDALEVSTLFHVAPSTARRYLELADSVEGLYRLVADARERSPDGKIASLPMRYPLDLMIAAGGPEVGMEWVEVHLRPDELVRGVLFEPTPTALWSDVVDVVGALSPHLTAAVASRMVRESSWSGRFPVQRALSLVAEGLPVEYLLAVPLD